MAIKKLNHPSLLSVIRAHNVSVFSMYGMPKCVGSLFNIELATTAPVLITRETVRGTQAAAKTPDAKRGVPNVQAVDFATLPSGTDTLLVAGTVLVTNRGTTLETCNDAAFTTAFREFMGAMVETGQTRVLAERFVMNLFNGSLLFRNRIGVNIVCEVEVNGRRVQVHESMLSQPAALSVDSISDAEVAAGVNFVIDAWVAAMTGKSHALTVAVRASVEMGANQEVYPSQEFAQDQEKGQGRVLALAPRNDGVKQAAMHGRKVGNALRTIDTWYPDALRALPVEPYAVDQSAQAALRTQGTDFYSLMVRMPELTQLVKAGTPSNDALYVAAVFLRGGVFSKKAEAKKSED